MGKPRLIGKNNAYIPNSKADLRYCKNAYHRGREIAEREPHATRAQRRDMRNLERAKREASCG